MKKLILLLLIGAGAYEYLERNPEIRQLFQPLENSVSAIGFDYSPDDQLLENAFKDRKSNLQIGSEGQVIRLLPDDLQGNRHQRFILQLATGQTLLVAHNIDLAPRINALRVGDHVRFYGEYEWNQKGGVIHWTHHDPRGSSEDCWLMHNGHIYK